MSRFSHSRRLFDTPAVTTRNWNSSMAEYRWPSPAAGSLPISVALRRRTTAFSCPARLWGRGQLQHMVRPLSLLLPQHQVHDPAPADVRLLGVAAVSENVVVVAPGVLQGVGEDRVWLTRRSFFWRGG